MPLDLSDIRIKLLLFIVGLIIVIILWAWLAGFMFLFFIGLSSTDATPFTIFQYWKYYSNIALIKFWLVLSIAITTVLFLGPFLPLLRKYINNSSSLYGDAGWASNRQIKKLGLLADDGIIVGQQNSILGMPPKYLKLGGSQHVLMSAPTRSGKGVGVVIPNLLSFKGSVVVLDIKQENWDITAGFRAAHGQSCYLLNLAPRDYLTHRWNPLHYISEDVNFRINDIQKIAQMLFPTIKGDAPIWQASARSLWLGVILYLIETETLPVTLGEALRQVAMGDELLQENVKKRQESDNKLSDTCYLALKEYFDTPHKTRGSIRKGFTSALELLYNPVIDAATAGNDFDLRDIRKKHMSIYVNTTVDDLKRLAPLISLFFQQVIDLNTRELPEKNPALKYQCLLLMDEFIALGKMDMLAGGIAFIAGYGLRMLPIIQSPSQLNEVYGHDASKTFVDNHALHVIFPPKRPEVAKEISEILGMRTVKSTSRSRQLIGKAGRSENASDHSRALLLPQEIIQMDKSVEFLLFENSKPIMCQKITWYNDKMFSERGNGRDGINWKMPIVPKIDPTKLVKGEVVYEKDYTTRDITIEDIENIDELQLKDFAYDFSKLKIPDNCSDEQINKTKQFFVDNFKKPKEA